MYHVQVSSIPSLGLYQEPLNGVHQRTGYDASNVMRGSQHVTGEPVRAAIDSSSPPLLNKHAVMFCKLIVAHLQVHQYWEEVRWLCGSNKPTATASDHLGCRHPFGDP